MASKRTFTKSEDFSSSEDEFILPISKGKSIKRLENRSFNNMENTSAPVNNTGQPARRRGRAPSKRPCLNRNALMARENRQKKKEYMQRIEDKLQQLQSDNNQLNNTIQKQLAEIKKLSSEVAYLKSILNNNTTITTLLLSMNESLKKMNNGYDPSQLNSDFIDNNFDKDGMGIVMNNAGLPGVSSNEVRDNQQTQLCNNINKTTNGKIFSRVPLTTARKSMPFNVNAEHNYISPKQEVSYIDSNIGMVDNKISKNSLTNQSYNNGYKYQNVESPDSTVNHEQLNTVNTSNYIDKTEISFSDTDFSQLSSLNVDFLDKFDDNVEYPLRFNTDAPDLFNEDTIFNDLEQEDTFMFNNFYNKSTDNPLTKTEIPSDDSNKMTNFNNPGVCLHINASQVSLEYCHTCHLNSLSKVAAI